MYTSTKYKVPLREVPRGVAQERNDTRMKYLHTCLDLTASHPSLLKCEAHTHIHEDRTAVLLLLSFLGLQSRYGDKLFRI